MNLIEYLCALGLMMICFAFLYRNRTKHYREYVSRRSTIGNFTIETPSGYESVKLWPGEALVGEPKPLDPNWKP